MTKKRQPKAGMQWKVIRGISIDTLERTLEEWTGKDWSAFTVMGPFNDGFAVVLHRLLVL